MEVPDGWARQSFDGGSLALPPASTASPGPERPRALLSRSLVVEGEEAGRIDVYAEPPPRPLPPGADPDDVTYEGSYVPLDFVPRCPGYTGSDTSEIEVPGGVGAVNVYEEALTPRGRVDTDARVVCVSYTTDPSGPGVQLVLQGEKGAVTEEVWRPVVASVRFD